MSSSWFIYVLFMWSFFIIIFIFIKINRFISLTQKNPFFGHVFQKFSLGVLLSICLIFCQFQPGVAYKSVAYKKACLVQRDTCFISREIYYNKKRENRRILSTKLVYKQNIDLLTRGVTTIFVRNVGRKRVK